MPKTTAGMTNISAGKFVWAFAFLAETWERLWPRLVPAFLIVVTFLTVSWLGLWQIVPDTVRWGLLGLFGFAFPASLLLFKGVSLPAKNSLFRRIEKASGFEHRPVTAQVDKLAASDASGSDPLSETLWREHQSRMASQLENLSVGIVRPNGDLFDRFALRAILPLFAFIALGYSFSVNGGRVADALLPRLDVKQVLSRLDVWITPPAYTAKPPIYLSEVKAATSIDGLPDEVPITKTPTGSELTIRYVGEGEITARIVADGESNAIDDGAETAVDGDDAFSAKEILTQTGKVEILARGEVIAEWPVDVIADTAPKIEFTQAPGRARSGALELHYSVEDDYGVTGARGVVSRLGEKNPNARPLVGAPDLPLPLPRARAKSGATKVNRDFSDHPWAGAEVELVLEALDDPGQVGRSSPVRITLPGRSFADPMAKALVEQRRLLAMDANAALLVSTMLEAVTTHPDVFDIDDKAYLALQVVYRKIADNRNDDELREAMDILWETALALELGDLSEVERKLREAQEKLSEALKNGASDEEIDRLMDELRQAMKDFLEQLAREMAENPIEQNPLADMQDMQTLTQRDLERMIQRIEDLAKSGSKDAARELLSEMQRMMDNLRTGRHQQQRQAEGNQLNQALDKLSELMQRQQELMDETFSMQRRQPQKQADQQQQDQQQGQRQQDQQQGQLEGRPQNDEAGRSGEPMTPEEFAEAMRQLQEQQGALEQQLSELGQQLEDLGLDPSQEFGEAGQEMAEAGRNLGKGNAGEAAGDQGQALDALRRGAQSMMQQMAGDRNQGGQQPGSQGQNGQQRLGGTDPLGRRNETNGRVDTEGTRIPEEIDAQRAREIMDAIRKRLSNPLRPLLERNYLDRLLKNK